MAKVTVDLPYGHKVDLDPETMTQEQWDFLEKVRDNPDILKPQKAATRNLTDTEPVKVLDKALRGGILSWPGMMMDLGYWGASKVDKHLLGREKPLNYPSDRLYELTGGPLSKPETKTGQVLGNIGESVIGTMATGGVNAVNAAMGLASGIGAEVGGALSDNPFARLLGGLAGGSLYGIASALRQPNEKEIIRGSVGYLTPEEIKSAKNAGKILNEKGMPYLNSQLFPPVSSLSDEVNLATGNPAARAEFLRAVDGVPEAMTKDIRQKADILLHPQMSLKGRRADFLEVQQRAKDIELNLLKKANEEFTKRLPAEQIYDSSKMTQIVKGLESMANSAKHKGGEGQSKLLAYINQHFPVTMDRNGNMARDSMSNIELNNKIKDLNSLSYDPNWKGLAIEDMKKYLKRWTPEFQAARDAKTKIMQTEVAPYRQSLAGTIAQMAGGPSENKYTVSRDISKMVFSSTASPRDIKELGNHLGPDALSVILRDHITQGLSKALKPTGGPAWQAPARFVDDILGTQTQQQNIKAALRIIGKDMGNTGDLLQAYKDILHGYGTYRNLKIRGGIDEATSDAKASLSALGIAIAPKSQGSRTVRELTMAKTHKALANLMTNPANFDKLVKIGQEKVPSRKSALIRSLIFNMDTTEPVENVEGKVNVNNP